MYVADKYMDVYNIKALKYQSLLNGKYLFQCFILKNVVRFTCKYIDSINYFFISTSVK